MRPPPERSYGQILSSSVLIGGSSLITILAGIVRTKFVATFLGPTGLGLMSLFSSLTSVVRTLAGMGVSTGGVRQIAEAAGDGEDARIGRTVATVRRIALRLGLFGATLLAIFRVPLSRATFGNDDHAGAIAIVSLVVAAGVVRDGQLALLQGLRRIGDLARVAVVGTIISLTLTLPIAYIWRGQAVVALLVMASAAELAASWWYARKVTVAPVAMKWLDTFNEAGPLLRIGLVSMSAALMVAAIEYVVRVVIVRSLGFEAAGIYQAATALSGVYCGFILSAMGADFLPRLSSIARDDASCNRLVNEQAEIGLLLAFPGICATLAFSPLIIQFLYSSQFSGATAVLRWQVLGVFLRVASWPMGYLLLAKGRASLYFWTEVSYNAVYAALIWICVRRWGLPGAGIAFFGLYVYYLLLMCVVTRRLSGFVWSKSNIRSAMISVPTIAFVFACPAIWPSPWHFVSSFIATIAAALYSCRTILSLTGHSSLRDVLAAPILQARAVRLKAAGLLRVKHG